MAEDGDEAGGGRGTKVRFTVVSLPGCLQASQRRSRGREESAGVERGSEGARERWGEAFKFTFKLETSAQSGLGEERRVFGGGCNLTGYPTEVRVGHA